MKLTKPYMDARISVITQGFHDDHNALDMVLPRAKKPLTYGTPLTAPEDVKIVTIIGDTFTGNTRNLKRGYGVVMQGLETGLFHLFWHTLPVQPVRVGDIVKRGKIVAFMGNAGTVRVGGEYVAIDDRLKPEKPGTHLHWEVMEEFIPRTWTKKGHVDPAELIDWRLEPTYTFADLIAATVIVAGKMSKIIK